MSPAKFLSVFLISSALLLTAHGRRLDEFSSEDDRFNEISEEFGRKLILSDVARIFSSAERQSTRSTNKVKRNNVETTESSKHAHGMIKSMLSFFSSALGFGRTILRNE